MFLFVGVYQSLQKNRAKHILTYMKNFPILVFDSGIGGLTTLFALKQQLPNEEFLYVADFLNAPYGSKTKDEILCVVTKTLTSLNKTYKPKMIVLACNTATAVCIKELRKTFPIPIVGCEPAIKLAQKEEKRHILVLCTKATKKYSQYLKGQKNITIFSPVNLAKMVDENFLFNEQKIVEYLEKTLKKFKLKFDAVILGCTHYVLFKKEIEQIMKSKAYEGNLYVAKRAKSVLTPEKSLTPKTTLLSTKKDRQDYLEQVFEKMKSFK